MNRSFSLLLTSLLAVTAAACSGGENRTSNTNVNTTTNANNANTANTNAASASSSSHSNTTTDETPASVRAAIPDAQTFTTQHKDVPQGTVAEVERETGTSVADRDRDHHAYLAFSTTGGARRQVGAGTVINTDAGEMVIVYDSRGGMPVIREVRGSSASAPAAFLDQFKGKTHDDALTFGKDIRAAGSVSEETARSITTAVKRDVLIMQALYGAPHSH